MPAYQDEIYRNSDNEYTEICRFLDYLATVDEHAHWESGRMNFWRYNLHAAKKHDDPFFAENVHVWRSAEGDLVALFISEYGKDDFFVEILPDHIDVWPEVFSWIDTHWAKSRSKIEIDVFSGDRGKIGRLEALGYAFSHHFENKRIYDLSSMNLEYALEPAFTVLSFSDTENYDSRVALVRSAFNSETYTVQNLKSLIASPDYVDDFHTVIVAEDGTHVAYCIGWFDNSADAAGYIEPVGTHADYRRRGLASAVIKECMKRMKSRGIQTVEIASRAEPAVSNYLYDSLGPIKRTEVHKYVRHLAHEGSAPTA